jgi:hypothetical protein
MKELLNITTRNASGEEAVVAIFVQNSEKVAPSNGRGVPPKTTDKCTVILRFYAKIKYSSYA